MKIILKNIYKKLKYIIKITLIKSKKKIKYIMKIIKKIKMKDKEKK